MGRRPLGLVKGSEEICLEKGSLENEQKKQCLGIGSLEKNTKRLDLDTRILEIRRKK